VSRISTRTSIRPPPPPDPRDIGAGAVIVTAADAERLGSATDTAVTLTVAGLGTDAGAEYTPAVEIVPTVVSPPAMPFTSQVTRESAVLATVATNV